MYHAGEWGTVCANGFSANDGNVVCKQLGYGRAVKTTFARDHRVGYGNGRLWMDGVACTGSEARLIDCPNTPICTNHWYDAYVECSSQPPLPPPPPPP